MPCLVCPSACSADVKVLSSVFPNEAVQVTASGMSAPDKGTSIVSYTFGLVTYQADGTATEVPGATTSSTSYTLTGLGVGTFSFWVIGTDSNGATIKVGRQEAPRKVLVISDLFYPEWATHGKGTVCMASAA